MILAMPGSTSIVFDVAAGLRSFFVRANCLRKYVKSP